MNRKKEYCGVVDGIIMEGSVDLSYANDDDRIFKKQYNNIIDKYLNKSEIANTFFIQKCNKQNIIKNTNSGFYSILLEMLESDLTVLRNKLVEVL